MRDHLLRTSGLAWFAYCSARKLAPNHYGLKHTQQAVLSNSDPACFLRKRKETTSPQYHPVSTLVAQLGANSGANFQSADLTPNRLPLVNSRSVATCSSSWLGRYHNNHTVNLQFRPRSRGLICHIAARPRRWEGGRPMKNIDALELSEKLGETARRVRLAVMALDGLESTHDAAPISELLEKVERRNQRGR